MELIYSAKILTGKDMREFGLANALYPHDELLEAARSFARELAARSAVSTALMRHMLYRLSAEPHPREAHKIDSLSMFYTSLGDGKEGVNAFLEKRDPEFESSTTTDMPPFFPWWE